MNFEYLDQFITPSYTYVDGDSVFLLLGDTGHGKSTFVERYMCLPKGCISSSSVKSKTTKTTTYRRPNSNIILIDTPGFYDSERRTLMQMGELVEICQVVGVITNVCFFVNVKPRFDESIQGSIKKYFEIIQNCSETNMLFYINHCDDEIDREDTIQILSKLMNEINETQAYQVYFSNNDIEDVIEVKEVISCLVNNLNPIESSGFVKLQEIRVELENNKAELRNLTSELIELKASNTGNETKMQGLIDEIQRLKDYRSKLNVSKLENVLPIGGMCKAIIRDPRTRILRPCKNNVNCYHHKSENKV